MKVTNYEQFSYPKYTGEQLNKESKKKEKTKGVRDDREIKKNEFKNMRQAIP